MNHWHSMTAPQVMDALKTSPHGLSHREAAARLARHGPNRLHEPPRPGLWRRLLDQLRDPMILVLLAAAVLSLVTGGGTDWADGVMILVIVVVNACISISQEDSAEKALAALRQMSAPTAHVLRDGRRVRLDAAQLVPGDIIFLDAGDLVPADARILECTGLQADESALTGESVPAAKGTAEHLPPELPLGDRSNMVLSSTVITGGRGMCVVTGTGMDTEVGRIAGLLLEQPEVDTPLQKKMAEVSKNLSFLCLCVCGVLFGAGLLQGRPLTEMLMTAVSLAVAAIPEGLPAIVTIVLAIGVQRMAQRGAIVKKLPAVETLGCAGVICSDKTGTLTRNRMTAVEVWTPPGQSRARALTIAALCGNTEEEQGVITGDPTETALAELAAREGLHKGELERQFPRVGELPFDSRRKRMATVHRAGDGFRVLVKGAPDVLLERCALTPGQRDAVRSQNAAMARKALRVIAVAYRDTASPSRLEDDGLERGLTFAGLIGMIDPPRREVKQAVARCHEAGIRPVMITGDHKLTAVAIAKEVGIFRPGDLAVTGAELDFMPREMLEADIERFSVFARVTPEHKLRIVRAWQARGQVAAMSGDGVNDAPALKAADIGCAMGRTGTDVAKGAADMILTDDNFATIVSAVAQGRGIYANIKKAIHYLLSCNIGEILTVCCATLLRFPEMPLAPVQLLWLNLVTDSLPALALGMEPVEADGMTKPPREPKEPLFTRGFALRLAWQGALVGGLTLLAYRLGLRWYSPQAANTMAFATLTMSQLFHAFDVRSESRSIFRLGLLSNPAMVKAFLVGMALQLSVLLFPPLMGVFSVCPLSSGAWGTVLALSLTPVAVCEVVKMVRGRS